MPKPLPFRINRKTRKQRAHRAGIIAEYAAMGLLWCKGYRVLHTRYRNSYGEIDIIAARRSFIVFIEVKYRHTQESAAESITIFQQQRITQAARLYIAEHVKNAGRRRPMAYSFRFDAIVIAPWTFPRHVKSAWETQDEI